MSEGSYSIEASVIMPIVLLTVIAFLLFGFFVRDTIFAEAYARSVLADYEDNEVDSVNKFDCAERVQECMWCSTVKYFRINEMSNRVEIEYKLVHELSCIRLRHSNTIDMDKKEKTSEKVYRWKVITDTAKGIFLAEE